MRWSRVPGFVQGYLDGFGPSTEHQTVFDPDRGDWYRAVGFQGSMIAVYTNGAGRVCVSCLKRTKHIVKFFRLLQIDWTRCFKRRVAPSFSMLCVH